MNLFLAPLLDGNKKLLGEGALAAASTLILVFLILAVIVVVTYYIGKAVNKALDKKQTPVNNEPATTPVSAKNPLNLDDEDAVVAALVASIDFRNQIKKDVKVVSIKEIK